MSTDKTEKRPFLGPFSDTDSDAEREGRAEHLGENGKLGSTSSVLMIAESEAELKHRVNEIEEQRQRSSVSSGGEERRASTHEQPGYKGKEKAQAESYVVSVGDQPEESNRLAELPGYVYKPKALVPQQSASDSDSEQEAVRETGKGRDPPARRSLLRPQVRDEVQGDSPRETERQRSSSFNRGRRSSRSVSPLDNDLEAQLDVARERARASNRRVSRVISPEPDFDSDFDTRDDEDLLPYNRPVLQRRPSFAAQMGERVPPEWALLLLGCFLGLASGLSVVTFNRGVHLIHDLAWAGTPHEGAAWLRLQKLIDIWHRIMLIPVVGGVVVGLMHGIVAILDQVKASRPRRRYRLDWLGGTKPILKATQAMVSLGTGCSLGPEGPSVDIGKAWGHGLATVMKNNRERRIALVAAGAAAGISAGFNAPVSGCFFAIETVLRPQHAENSPPLTTAMIILASVISSTVSQVLFGETAAFTVPTYELRSAAELPLYLLLGGLCGVVSVIFTRMTDYFTHMFEFLRDRIGIPATVTPAIGGLVTGLLALRYPGVLYWGFTNIDEILHSGKTATAPGQGLLVQLICAKVFATSFCKGSGLVGGVYAPSLFIGAAVGSVYGTMAGKAINAAMPGHDTVAHPQAYALVGMAALLAGACSVPLTSVLLLFELTKDYHILLPLMGGIGVAIWVASVAKQSAEKQLSAAVPGGPRSGDPGTSADGVQGEVAAYRQQVWRRKGNEGMEVELCTLGDNVLGPDIVPNDELMDTIKVSQAMSKHFVKVLPFATVKETIAAMLKGGKRCAHVVDENDLLEGIFTCADLENEVLKAAEMTVMGDPTLLEVEKTLVAALCSGKGDNQGEDTDLVVCFPDMSLRSVLDLMNSCDLDELPVVARAGKRWQDQGRQLVGVIDRSSIPRCVKEEASKRIAEALKRSHEDDGPMLDGH
ncbi:hypothetical protein R1sor_002948 [Riccia sorocarpa]|uniref:Chloride channel protein n=1 Tax=Riccia sorocarpa TaxID=122646 RepID=A0ABD3H4D3_9MARC